MSSEKNIDTSRLVGQVKWFNNKDGYGFITVSDSSEYSGKDIFAHFSNIGHDDTQYRYLVQGEYVEFNLTTSKNKTHEYQATNISGINRGMLMCETRQMHRPQVKIEKTASTESAKESQTPLTLEVPSTPRVRSANVYKNRQHVGYENRQPRSSNRVSRNDMDRVPENTEDGFQTVRSKRGQKRSTSPVKRNRKPATEMMASGAGEGVAVLAMPAAVEMEKSLEVPHWM